VVSSLQSVQSSSHYIGINWCVDQRSSLSLAISVRLYIVVSSLQSVQSSSHCADREVLCADLSHTL
jgi:hypothetical protein